MSAHDHMCSSESSQSELVDCNFSFYSHSENPICIRDTCGNFIYSNSMFSECIKGTEYDCQFWFNKLPIETRCALLARELDALSEPTIAVVKSFNMEDSFRWYVLYQVVRVNGNNVVVWLFMKNIVVVDSGNKTAKDIRLSHRTAIHPQSILQPQDYETFCLYFSGVTHQRISQLLGITVSASKKRISKTYQQMNIKGRSEMSSYLEANSFLQNIHVYAFEIIQKKGAMDI